MGGTWTSQDKVLPGLYINVQTNVPLSISESARGTVAMLQEMSTGNVGDIYVITPSDASAWPAAATTTDKFFAGEALKRASTVKVYNLGSAHTPEVLAAALAALETVNFDVLCYPYPAATYAANQTTIKTWVDTMINDEGREIQAVLADCAGDDESIIDCAHAVILSDDTTLTNAQTCAWVAGATAGAQVNESNTGATYDGAVYVSPRMKKSDMEAAVNAGKFIFQVDSSQNVTAVYDINSLVTYTTTKSKKFRKNRLIRLLSGIRTDINTVFESNIKGKVNNNSEGRAYFKTLLVDYFGAMENKSAIQNFSADDVTVAAGTDDDAWLVTAGVANVDSAEKCYMTVNLS